MHSQYIYICIHICTNIYTPFCVSRNKTILHLRAFHSRCHSVNHRSSCPTPARHKSIAAVRIVLRCKVNVVLCRDNTHGVVVFEASVKQLVTPLGDLEFQVEVVPKASQCCETATVLREERKPRPRLGETTDVHNVKQPILQHFARKLKEADGLHTCSAFLAPAQDAKVLANDLFSQSRP